MKPLVWALYLLLQAPGVGDATDGHAVQSWAFTGVTYLNREACRGDAATFTNMPTPEKADGIQADSNVAYVCVRQPKPGNY